MRASLCLGHSFTVISLVIHLYNVIWPNFINTLLPTGTGLTVQHFRNTSSGQCDAVEELKPIDQNLKYDFDFQVFLLILLYDTFLCFNYYYITSTPSLLKSNSKWPICRIMLTSKRLEMAGCRNIRLQLHTYNCNPYYTIRVTQSQCAAITTVQWQDHLVTKWHW